MVYNSWKLFIFFLLLEKMFTRLPSFLFLFLPLERCGTRRGGESILLEARDQVLPAEARSDASFPM
jgi:hypothetical protein